MTQLLAVNVGQVREVEVRGRVVSTAIWKSPVEGRVAVRGVNVEGDDQADRTVHGGRDKAVYAYAIEETRLWEYELGRELGPGAFGENLTTQGLGVSTARVGERWRIGTAVLEVVQPRLPCYKLGIRFDDPRFVKTFAQANRPGAYLRIVEEGEVGAGDDIVVEFAPDHDVTVELMMRALLHERQLLPRLLEAPQLSDDWRELVFDKLGYD